jgi:acetyl-CoA carboxylase biotin carboxyl carrier protein
VSDTVDPRSRSELRALLRAIEESGWEYARVEMDGVTLTVSSDPDFVGLDAGGSNTPAATTPAASTASAAPVSPARAPEPSTTEATEATASPGVSDSAHTVTAPSIGLFWRSPKPGAPPFVEVGDRVGVDDTVCIIEVMKLMTHVPAGVAGVVRAIRVANGDMVEHGTALVDIEPEDAR